MSDSSATASDDAAHMRRALALAERGWGQTAPNPMVGAVVVARGVTVGEGFHARYGEAHAEVVALRAAGDSARGATLHVSLEPCVHFGQTPPCVGAIVAAGVERVVIAALDPSDVARGGADALRAAGIRVDVGPAQSAALELNAPFYNAHASDRPWVTLKLALSADGAIADPTGVHRWITGDAARKEVHRRRANADAIAVGIGTVLADDPALTVRDAPEPRVPPRRVVFDSTLRIPLESTLVATARDVPTTIITAPEPLGVRAGNLEAAGVRVRRATSLRGALTMLRADEVRSLFVE
ncbi:MAG TPA: bifunctional diaminohydroxyphosphoribosylaminopyrimidine deaminase/5-amino-6-(5-phosphoribosylamino)uracil reductase RibD, partial [Gemmatimonadaceae bacterium]|nr:bifunctional diaminohydroxyphosphoribosylaminopyrimidine deaminase/5-amino-6-(5-phosphoribosylamino)uracil reductase RibD [Gemmatimonadaceae bacterium]